MGPTTVLTMKVPLLFLLCVVGFATSSTWTAGPASPLHRRARAAQRTRFFTGNNVIDTTAASGTGAVLGVATQYIANQVFNPCRNSNRNNNRIVSGQTIQSGAYGFALGFAGASLVHNALGRPCGR